MEAMTTAATKAGERYPVALVKDDSGEHWEAGNSWFRYQEDAEAHAELLREIHATCYTEEVEPRADRILELETSAELDRATIAELRAGREAHIKALVEMTATAIGGISDAAIIGPGPFDERHTLEAVRLLASQAAELRAEVETARRTANYWKANGNEANKEIDRLRGTTSFEAVPKEAYDPLREVVGPMVDNESIGMVPKSTDAWFNTARQYANDMDFYRKLVIEIGELFGDAAKTCDDGSMAESVLALKVPELVRELREVAQVACDALADPHKMSLGATALSKLAENGITPNP